MRRVFCYLFQEREIQMDSEFKKSSFSTKEDVVVNDGVNLFIGEKNKPKSDECIFSVKNKFKKNL